MKLDQRPFHFKELFINILVCFVAVNLILRCMKSEIKHGIAMCSRFRSFASCSIRHQIDILLWYTISFHKKFLFSQKRIPYVRLHFLSCSEFYYNCRQVLCPSQFTRKVESPGTCSNRNFLWSSLRNTIVFSVYHPYERKKISFTLHVRHLNLKLLAQL